ncbi:hypothetical protein EV421DRAFT_1745622 [Armillaria borealis]|uniref:Uncharacterized protein n=1 Tax=Armillaria borealis TaxID=47425 RepID=A0AA39IE29_9AGAR|nr:hypothetical protein EV421DRAFT_1745622 [Armillaria borealis]
MCQLDGALEDAGSHRFEVIYRADQPAKGDAMVNAMPDFSNFGTPTTPWNSDTRDLLSGDHENIFSEYYHQKRAEVWRAWCTRLTYPSVACKVGLDSADIETSHWIINWCILVQRVMRGEDTRNLYAGVRTPSRIEKRTRVEMVQENTYRALDMVVLQAVHTSRASLKLVLLGPRNFDTFSPKTLLPKVLTKRGL